MLNSVNADNLSKAILVYLKLKVEKGLSGSSKISKLANSFSSFVRLLTPEDREMIVYQLQCSHRLEKHLNLEGLLEKSLMIISALKSAGKSLKGLEKYLNSTIFCRTTLLIETLISLKLQHMLHQIKAQQFYTNFLVLISPLSQSSISEVEF